MITKPTINSTPEDLLQFVHDWVKLCSKGKSKEAFSLLDEPFYKSTCKWTLEDFEEIRFDHFDDGKQPEVSDPDSVKGNLRKDVFEFNNHSGWGVEFDLPLNGIVSDFTLLFEFLKKDNSLKVILQDCHVM